MGHMTDGLTFNVLRQANLKRLPQFKNSKGKPAHSKTDGSDWKLSAWGGAVSGELGESAEALLNMIKVVMHLGSAANMIKKVERGDYKLEEARANLAKELADVQTYLDLLAFRAGIDLGQATIAKFNEVSERVGSTIRIAEDGSDWHYAEAKR